jgi:mono/diheme cytochrome c family protein
VSLRVSFLFSKTPLTALAISAAALLSSCSGSVSRKPAIEIFNDMRQQPKYYPQGESAFGGFGDGRAERRPVPGTVRHPEPQPFDSSKTGTMAADDPFLTGQVNGMYVAQNVLPITPDLLVLGQSRFNTYCSPCHGRAGNGKGIVGARSNWIASNLVDDRVKAFSDGDYFDVITHGRRSMPAYRYQITEHDRWAIVAYVRALQRTTSGTLEDVPADLRSELR